MLSFILAAEKRSEEKAALLTNNCKHSSSIRHVKLKHYTLPLTWIVPEKPLGNFINISLTSHYNPIIQPMFTAILVSLLWLDSFYFILEFITHTSHLPIEIAVPLGPQWWKIYLPQCLLKSSEMPAVSFVVSLRLLHSCSFISSTSRGTHEAVTHTLTGVTFNSRFLMTSERALTADLHALIKAIFTVVLSITKPLFGNALVLWAGKLVPQAWRVYRGQWERNFSAIYQTKRAGNRKVAECLKSKHNK